MHPRVEVGHAQHAEAAYEAKTAAGHEENPAGEINHAAHPPRSPYSKNLRTAMVPTILSSPYTIARSRKSGRPVRKPMIASSRTASVPIVLAPSRRSNTVGPSTARV